MEGTLRMGSGVVHGVFVYVVKNTPLPHPHTASFALPPPPVLGGVVSV